MECAWASLRYNPWAKAVYERVSGKQKTRKKKAAVALARKLAVIAWALLRDEKDWQPKRMIEITESFGKMPQGLKVTLEQMKPKENSDQRKKRLRKEAREARQADAARTNPALKKARTSGKSQATATPKAASANPPLSRSADRRKPNCDSRSKASQPNPKPRRARNPGLHSRVLESPLTPSNELALLAL